MNFHRILQGTVLTTAVALGAGYVWWAQYQANAGATATRPETPPSPPVAEEPSPESSIYVDPSVEVEIPIFDPSGLALSSKTISMPIFDKRKISTTEPPPSVEEPQAPTFSGFGLISGSKSIGIPIKAPSSGDGTQEAQMAPPPPGDNTVPPLVRRSP